MKLLDLLELGVLVDEEDLVLLDQHVWHISSHGYVMTSPHEGLLLHRLISGAQEGQVVDHINGNTLDNRRGNLRNVDQTRNQANRKHLNRNNSSGLRGVQYVPHLSAKRPWRAQITARRRNYHLGLFPSAAEAVRARREAELALFGEPCP